MQHEGEHVPSLCMVDLEIGYCYCSKCYPPYSIQITVDCILLSLCGPMADNNQAKCLAKFAIVGGKVGQIRVSPSGLIDQRLRTKHT